MEFTPDAKRAFHQQTYGPAPVIDGVTLVPLARHVDGLQESGAGGRIIPMAARRRSMPT